MGEFGVDRVADIVFFAVIVWVCHGLFLFLHGIIWVVVPCCMNRNNTNDKVNVMKKLCLLLVSLMVCSLSEAQTWYNANVGGVLFGQGWTSEVGTKYQRFPDRASSLVPSGVWSLSKNTAGATSP